MSVNIRTPLLYGKNSLEISVTTAKFYHEHLEKYFEVYVYGLDLDTTEGAHAKNVLGALTDMLGTIFIDRHDEKIPTQLELFWIVSNRSF